MELAGVSAPTVTVFISSSLNSFRSEKRFNRGLTLAEFKVWRGGGGVIRRGAGPELEGVASLMRGGAIVVGGW